MLQNLSCFFELYLIYSSAQLWVTMLLADQPTTEILFLPDDSGKLHLVTILKVDLGCDKSVIGLMLILMEHIKCFSIIIIICNVCCVVQVLWWGNVIDGFILTLKNLILFAVSTLDHIALE